MKVGMRTIKTAISVAISIFVLGLLGVKTPFFACMTAVFTMQADVPTSFRAGIERFLGTLTGAVVGSGFALLTNYLPMENLLIKVLIVPIGLIFVIQLFSLLKLNKSTFIACIVYLALMVHVEGPLRIEYAITRTLTTAFGALVALLINRYVYPNSRTTQAPNVQLSPSDYVSNSCNQSQ